MRPIVTDGVEWCVCLLVVWSAAIVNPAKNSWTDPDSRYCFGYGRRLGSFDGENVMCTEMAGWKSKINNSSTTESKFWGNTRPSAFQLQETMLKTDKIWCTYLVINCVSVRTFWPPVMFCVFRAKPAFRCWRPGRNSGSYQGPSGARLPESYTAESCCTGRGWPDAGHGLRWRRRCHSHLPIFRWLCYWIVCLQC